MGPHREMPRKAIRWMVVACWRCYSLRIDERAGVVRDVERVEAGEVSFNAIFIDFRILDRMSLQVTRRSVRNENCCVPNPDVGNVLILYFQRTLSSVEVVKLLVPPYGM